MGIFSRKISISADVDQFEFTNDGRCISFRTVVFLSATESNRILSIGIGPQGAESVAVSLFGGGVSPQDKFELVAAFLRFGLHEVGGRSFRSPAITFRVTPGLAARLAGFHRMILSEAARQAGAVSITFEDVEQGALPV